MKIGVFCSSSSEIESVYFTEIALFSKAIVQSGHKIIYGGSREGLMECLANSAIEEGGFVTGVVPKYFLHQKNLTHNGLSELIVVEDLKERKEKLIGLSDLLVAFPGGIGTMDEMLSVMTLKQLKEPLVRPLLIYNFLNYWSGFIEFLKELKAKKAITLEFGDLFVEVKDYRDAMKKINRLE